VKMDMPNPNAPPPVQAEPPPVFNLEIDFDGTVIWDGAVIPDQTTLEQRLLAASHMATEPEFHIRPNKLVEYKHVIRVLAAARRRGITKIGLVGNEQFFQR
ncbi:MAG: ExbD/TolR family protein, partial [Nevskiales bacterium]